MQQAPIFRYRRFSSKAQRGVAMAEFVISLPFLLMAIAAVAEFGVIFYTHTTLNSLVQDGARYLAANSIYGASTYTQLTTDNRREVANLVVYGKINPTDTDNPLLDNLDSSMVQITCLNGSDPTLRGIRCRPDTVINISSITPFSVSVQVQYVPIMGSLITNLTGTSLSIPLRASANNVSF